ncbi:MAG: helix-turn-helix transcriptional regulator [Bacteroidetes bacterium]|nr:helix-turn-helix transcriptional regulator [Bacteroidota bacterium]
MRVEIADFFKPMKLKSRLPVWDYESVKLYLQVVEAFAQTTHQCVYIIDYYKQGFMYVSDNPLFLCGETARDVRKLGYEFYAKHVPPDELTMLLEINEAGFNFYYNIPVFDRLNYTISYDFHLMQPNKRLTLINHKLTPLVLDEDNNIWLALCVVTHSSNNTAGNIIIAKKGENKRFEYDRTLKEWITQKRIKFSPKEKEVLALSAQGYTMDEIANKLELTGDTIKFHKKNIFKKLHVKNMVEALSCATNHNLFE